MSVLWNAVESHEKNLPAVTCLRERRILPGLLSYICFITRNPLLHLAYCRYPSLTLGFYRDLSLTLGVLPGPLSHSWFFLSGLLSYTWFINGTPLSRLAFYRNPSLTLGFLSGHLSHTWFFLPGSISHICVFT